MNQPDTLKRIQTPTAKVRYKGFYRLYGKRTLDLLVASCLLLLTLPIMLFCMLAIFITMGRPVCFTQTRVGRGEKLFTIFKLRTMSNETDEEGALLPDEMRKTWIGSLIRRLSLDELPQLLNVLTGEMSLVGPRPLLEGYLPYYSERERLRHTVTPGITGLAQVNGRNATTWNKRLEFDAQYAESYSLALDMKIIGLTARKVFVSDPIESGAVVTIGLLSEERKRAA
jgi:undecaprenyl phosphate N,N'-diacetylbacillosamine 1-phosphate transferase